LSSHLAHLLFYFAKIWSSDPGPVSLTDGVLPGWAQGTVPREKAVPDPGVCLENFSAALPTRAQISFFVYLALLMQPTHSSVYSEIQSPAGFMEHNFIFLTPKHERTSSMLFSHHWNACFVLFPLNLFLLFKKRKHNLKKQKVL
jgi:hypothetical protein